MTINEFLNDACDNGATYPSESHHASLAPPCFAGAAPSLSSLEQPTRQPQPSMIQQKRLKAQKHRKRHVPVGPAGIWFQKQQQQQRTDSRVHEEDDEDEDDDDGKFSRSSVPRHRRREAYCVYSPSWTAAQCALQLTTPMTFPIEWSVSQKSTILRRCLPDSFVLITEILAGNHDWRIDKQLLCQITSIQEHIFNDHLWTVMLQDETGAEIAAWLQPSLVEQQQSNSNKSSSSGSTNSNNNNIPAAIKVGHVWLIAGAAIHLIAASPFRNHNHDATTSGPIPIMDRMLLISQSNIRNVWSPASADQIPNDEYIAWMERRNSLSAEILANHNVTPRTIPDEMDVEDSDDDDVVINDDVPNEAQLANTEPALTQTVNQRKPATSYLRDTRLSTQTISSSIPASSVPSHDKHNNCQLSSNICNIDTNILQITASPNPQSIRNLHSVTGLSRQFPSHNKVTEKHVRHGVDPQSVALPSPPQQPQPPPSDTVPRKEIQQLVQHTSSPAFSSPLDSGEKMYECHRSNKNLPVIHADHTSPPLRDIFNDQGTHERIRERKPTNKMSSALWTGDRNSMFDFQDDLDDEDEVDDIHVDAMDDPREVGVRPLGKNSSQLSLPTSQSNDIANKVDSGSDDPCTMKKSSSGSMFQSAMLAGFDIDEFSDDDQ